MRALLAILWTCSGHTKTSNRYTKRTFAVAWATGEEGNHRKHGNCAKPLKHRSSKAWMESRTLADTEVSSDLHDASCLIKTRLLDTLTTRLEFVHRGSAVDPWDRQSPKTVLRPWHRHGRRRQRRGELISGHREVDCCVEHWAKRLRGLIDQCLNNLDKSN